MQKINEQLVKFGLEPYTRLPIVQKISQKTKAEPQMIIVGVIGVFALFCLLPFLGNLLTTTVCFLLPAYYTFKAIESADQADDNRLLTYWIIFGLVYSMDELFRSILGFIPGYHLFRFGAMLYLYRNTFGGAEMIYSQFVKPLFNKYVSQIDALIEPIEERSRNVSEQFKKRQ